MSLMVLAQLFGLASFIVNVIGTQKNKKESILFCNGAANVFSAIQYIFLGKYTGSLSCIVATVRNIVFNKYKDKKIPIWILILYLICAISLSIPFVKNPLDIIPVANICLFGLALYQNDVEKLKVISTIVDFTGAIYDIYSMAIMNMLSELFATVSSLIGLIRYKKIKEKIIETPICEM